MANLELHVLYNGGDGTYDVVNVTDTGEIEYVSTEFMDGQHATAYIAGWHDGRSAGDVKTETPIYEGLLTGDYDNVRLNPRLFNRRAD